MDEAQEFEAFFSEVEPRLSRALVAVYGSERGREATAEALGWAWEHRHQLGKLDSPVAYLFRVGTSRTKHRNEPLVFERSEHIEPWVEPGLGAALAALTERQRVAVVLVRGFSWTLREVAELTGIRVTTVQSNLERGLRNLRVAMEVNDHA